MFVPAVIEIPTVVHFLGTHRLLPQIGRNFVAYIHTVDSQRPLATAQARIYPTPFCLYHTITPSPE